MSETDLVTQTRRLLLFNGIWCERNNTGGWGRTRYGLGKGGPDLVAVDQGRAFALEAKAEGGIQSADQKDWAIGWKRAGGFYTVFHVPLEALLFIKDLRG